MMFFQRQSALRELRLSLNGPPLTEDHKQYVRNAVRHFTCSLQTQYSGQSALFIGFYIFYGSHWDFLRRIFAFGVVCVRFYVLISLLLGLKCESTFKNVDPCS